jgi:multidrug efflux pump
MYISFYSESMEANQITDYLTRAVQPRITAINGVQKADILGARTFAMRIWLKPQHMAALGITPTEIRNALSANNYLSTLGGTKGSLITVNLVANTNLKSVNEFKNLVLKERNGSIIRLQDVADIVLGAESYDTDVRFSGQKAIFMGVWVLPTSNSLDVISAVRNELPQIEKQLPIGMHVHLSYDATGYIRDALHEVLWTLSETLLIVICVIFLFLGNWRSILVPVVAIPLSLAGALFLIQTMGFTLNLLTLLAIVLSVGLVVDDAIVVVENVERHLQEGLSPMESAMKAARELVGPLIAMTVTLAAVYAPIGLQGGLTGTLFKEFAFTLAGAVVVSGVVALTLSPMMSSKLLRAQDSHTGFGGWVNQRFDALRQWYKRRLIETLRWRPVTLTLAGIVMLLGVPFYMLSMKELAPKEDQGVILGVIQAAPNSTIDQTMLYASLVNDVYFSLPETSTSFQIIEAFGGFSGLVTKPWSQRKRSTEQMVGEVFGKTAQIPGVRVIAFTPSALPGGGNYPVEFVIASTAEPKELLEFANALVAAAFQSKLFVFADTDLKFDFPQTEVVFDRDKVASMGLNLSQVGADLGTMLGGAYVNRFSIEGRSYKVIPQLERASRLNADQLKDLYVTGPGGKLVQLSTFATLLNTTEPRTLNRFQQLNSARIQGVIPPNITLDQALKALEAEAAKILPKGYSIDYAGEGRQLRVEGNKLLLTLAFSGVLIFLVLAAQFESFRDPLVILAGSVPLALSGALLFSFLGFTTLNIYSQVGLITLVGLVSKNGILIVEFANTLRVEGASKLEAVIEAASTRLRPILMTSVATVFGHFPLVIAKGPGAGARNSIGIVLVTGMIIGTLLTLFVVPAVYMALSHQGEGDSAKQS